MELWITGVMNKLDRKKVNIFFSEHAAKDKNLDMGDVDNAVKTVQIGKVDEKKSTQEKERICFKNYFDMSEIAKINDKYLRFPSMLKNRHNYYISWRFLTNKDKLILSLLSIIRIS